MVDFCMRFIWHMHSNEMRIQTQLLIRFIQSIAHNPYGPKDQQHKRLPHSHPPFVNSIAHPINYLSCDARHLTPRLALGECTHIPHALG